MNTQKTELLQIQADRFTHNWRKVGEGECEITYVNRLELKGHDLRAQPGRAMKLLRQGDLQPGREGARLPEMENCNLVARYVLKNADGEPRGRLVVTVQAWPKEPVLRLDLTVRGAPMTADFEAVADFLDEGRKTIVHGFTAITTKQMHETWGRVK